jgi:hypothetical protein
MPIKLHKQGNRYYYQYGTTGHKYYFTTPIGAKRAYNKALKQTRAIKISENLNNPPWLSEDFDQSVFGNGGSLKNFIKEVKRHYRGIVMAFKGVRTNIKPSARKILEENIDQPIVDLKVARTPLSDKFGKIIDLANDVEGTKKPHDKLFHLYFIATLKNGKQIRIEKNQDVNVIPYKPAHLEETEQISLNNTNLTPTEFLTKAKEKMGSDFYHYDAFSTNCQHFVHNVLQSNEMESKPDFILQDVKNLVPQWGKNIAHFATDLANRALTAIQGEGTNK